MRATVREAGSKVSVGVARGGSSVKAARLLPRLMAVPGWRCGGCMALMCGSYMVSR